MSVLASAALSALLLPPTVFVLLAAAGLTMLGHHRRVGVAIIVAALAALMIASTPFAGERLLRSLEPRPLAAAAIRAPASATAALGSAPARGTLALARTNAARSREQAIVVLGAGLTRAAPEYGTDTANRASLERLRYASLLHRANGLPMLVSGGRPFDSSLSEADTLRESLSADFRTPPRWVEGESRTTRENARRTRAMLAPESIDRIYLVTHAWHMPRARRAFERAGFAVTPAPTGFTPLTAAPQAWIPSATALQMTHVAMREWLGEAWYRLNSGPSQ